MAELKPLTTFKYTTDILQKLVEEEHWSAEDAMIFINTIPDADVAPMAEMAREIFEEIYKTMNSVYASVQHSCVGMHGDNPETMRLLGKLEGVKHLGDELAELKKKYIEEKHHETESC